MKFKISTFISAIVLASSSLLAVPAMAAYHCFGKNISVVIDNDGWASSYEGHTKSGQLYLGSNQVVSYSRGNHIKWNNGGYIYKVLLSSRSGKPYRVRVYKPNGRRIVNKKLSCRWQD
jgi:hypothetical protein